MTTQSSFSLLFFLYNYNNLMRNAAKVKKILKLLNKAYGKPPDFKRSPPLDELIRTILSQNTSDRNSLKAFAVLKKNFKSWDALAAAEAGKITRLIRHAGLARIKAGRIKGVLNEIRRREGRIGLSSLSNSGVKESLSYLRSLKGVGPKTAACVLLFSFGKPVMPVDTHIFRVTKRLGIIDKGITIEDAHAFLSDMVPKDLIYEFHLGIIEHGRRICKANNPRCAECVVYRLCSFLGKNIYFKKGRVK